MNADEKKNAVAAFFMFALLAGAWGGLKYFNTSWFASFDTTSEEIRASGVFWLYVSGAFVGAAVLVITGGGWLKRLFLAIWALIVRVYNFLFDQAVKGVVRFLPSDMANRVRAGGRTDGKFHENAPNAFARSVDVAELLELVKEAQARKEKLQELEREAIAKGRAAEVDANEKVAVAQARIDELKAKIAELDRQGG